MCIILYSNAIKALWHNAIKALWHIMLSTHTDIIQAKIYDKMQSKLCDIMQSKISNIMQSKHSDIMQSKLSDIMQSKHNVIVCPQILCTWMWMTIQKRIQELVWLLFNDTCTCILDCISYCCTYCPRCLASAIQIKCAVNLGNLGSNIEMWSVWIKKSLIKHNHTHSSNNGVRSNQIMLQTCWELPRYHQTTPQDQPSAADRIYAIFSQSFPFLDVRHHQQANVTHIA